ncbi:MAG: hypothetical protein HQ507_08835 [Candidatus Marinimicrobia bacterium]|nr:hypothetical protein [Candidatus Neomarinimicrobiota bacterium]
MITHLSKHLVAALPSFIILTLIWNCEVVEPNEAITAKDTDAIRINYNGITQDEGQSLASFSIVNDSTESIQYFGYDPQSMHYSTEMLTDTGWVYLSWNWCGTGASYYPLEPDSQIEFRTGLPSNSCTWRVLLNISDMELTTSHMLKSESIQYFAP